MLELEAFPLLLVCSVISPSISIHTQQRRAQFHHHGIMNGIKTYTLRLKFILLQTQSLIAIAQSTLVRILVKHVNHFESFYSSTQYSRIYSTIQLQDKPGSFGMAVFRDVVIIYLS